MRHASKERLYNQLFAAGGEEKVRDGGVRGRRGEGGRGREVGEGEKLKELAPDPLLYVF